jgi:hypothetical protein
MPPLDEKRVRSNVSPVNQIPQQKPVALRRVLGAVAEERDVFPSRKPGMQAGFAPTCR